MGLRYLRLVVWGELTRNVDRFVEDIYLNNSRIF